jgi:hypothetical protein
MAVVRQARRAAARIVSAFLGVTLVALCAAPAANGAQALATTFSGTLISFDTGAPGTILSSAPITGLPSDTIGSVRDIDLRPATGGLFGIAAADTNPDPFISSYVYRFYSIDTATATATQIGGNIAGDNLGIGFDFDPVTDVARLVDESSSQRNLRINPTTGAVTPDTALHPAGNVVGIAYDRNVAGTPATTLYGIDYGTNQDTLVRIGGVDGNPSPTGGQVTIVGSLGLDTASNATHFDISPSGTAYAVLRPSGVGSHSHLYTLDLNTGTAVDRGQIGDGSFVVSGLTVFAAPASPSSPPAPTPGGSGAVVDRTPPNAVVTVKRTLKLKRVLATRGFTFSFRCDEACTAKAALTPNKKSSALVSATLGKGTAQLPAAGLGRLKVRLTKLGRRRLGRLRRSRSRRARFSLATTFTDLSSNRRKLRRTVTVRKS